MDESEFQVLLKDTEKYLNNLSEIYGDSLYIDIEDENENSAETLQNDGNSVVSEKIT